MSNIPFTTIDWTVIEKVEHKGEIGSAYWQTIQYPGLRIRLVEYTPGYKADHWCRAGHIVYCLDGEMTAELSDGRSFTLSKGMSYQVSDNVSVHRSYSKTGVKLLIVDGNFLADKKETFTNPWKM